jgi:RNA-directed DNA polymerase
MEGRLQPRENTGQSHAIATERPIRVKGSGRCAPSGAGKEEERFTTLLHHLHVDLLNASYLALQRNAAPGVDPPKWPGPLRCGT